MVSVAFTCTLNSISALFTLILGRGKVLLQDHPTLHC